MVDTSKGFTTTLQQRITPSQYKQLTKPVQRSQVQSSVVARTLPTGDAEEIKRLKEQKEKDLQDVDRRIKELEERIKSPNISNSYAKELIIEAGMLRNSRSSIQAGFSKEQAMIQARARRSKERELESTSKLTTQTLEFSGGKAKFTSSGGGKFVEATIKAPQRKGLLSQPTKRSPENIISKRQGKIFVDEKIHGRGSILGTTPSTSVSQSVDITPGIKQRKIGTKKGEDAFNLAKDIFGGTTGTAFMLRDVATGFSNEDLNRALARNLEKSSFVPGTGNIGVNILTLNLPKFVGENIKTARKIRKSGEEDLARLDAQQRILNITTPEFESKAQKVSEFNVDVGSFNRDVKDFNELYGDRELTAEEFTTASERQKKLSKRELALTGRSETLSAIDPSAKYSSVFKNYGISTSINESSGLMTFTSPEIEKVRSGGLAPLFYKNIQTGFENKGVVGGVGTAIAQSLYTGGVSYLTFAGIGRLGAFAKLTAPLRGINPAGKTAKGFKIITGTALAGIGGFGAFTEYQKGEFYGRQLGLPKGLAGVSGSTAFLSEFGGAIGGSVAGTKAYYTGIQRNIAKGSVTYNVRGKLPTEVREGELFKRYGIRTGNVQQEGKYITRFKGTNFKVESDVRLKPGTFYEKTGQSYINIKSSLVDKGGKTIGKPIISSGELLQKGDLGKGRIFTTNIKSGKIIQSDFGVVRDVEKSASVSFDKVQPQGFVKLETLKIRFGILDLGTKQTQLKVIPQQAFTGQEYRSAFGNKDFFFKDLRIDTPKYTGVTLQQVRYNPELYLGQDITKQTFTSTSNTITFRTSAGKNLKFIGEEIVDYNYLRSLSSYGKGGKASLTFSLPGTEKGSLIKPTSPIQTFDVKAPVVQTDLGQTIGKQLSASGILSSTYSGILSVQKPAIALASQLKVKSKTQLKTAQKTQTRVLTQQRTGTISEIIMDPIPDLKVDVIPKTIQGTRTTTKTTTRTTTGTGTTTPPPPPILITPPPFIPFNFSVGAGRETGSTILKGGKRRTKYIPSVSAIFLNITGTYKPSKISKSGLDFRPLMPLSKKKGKSRGIFGTFRWGK